MLIDTHAHLDFPEFATDFDEILARARAAGVDRIITIGTSLEGSRRAVALAEQHAGVFAVVGVHPNSAGEAVGDVMNDLRELAKSPRVVGIGETGLDYHRLPGVAIRTGMQPYMALTGIDASGEIDADLRDGAVKAAQAAVFEQQLELAAELGLNVVIHERDAWSDTVAMLRRFTGRFRAVFHCFGKGIEHAEEVLALGHLVSFTGILTFKNAESLHETAARIPAGMFMVETDCPFLAPVPHRGKRCEPAHVRDTAELLASLRGETLEAIASQTTATAEAFFRFPK